MHPGHPLPRFILPLFGLPVNSGQVSHRAYRETLWDIPADFYTDLRDRRQIALRSVTIAGL